MNLKPMTLKYPLFFLLFYMANVTSNAQGIPFKKSYKDTLIPMSALFDLKQTIFHFRNEVRAQQYELNVYKALGKIDSLHYGTDSLITVFISRAGQPLLRVKQKQLIAQNIYDDSIVVYYNKNGLIEYSEIWQTESKKTLRKMKLTCRRYEYDDQNRVIHYVVDYPTPRTLEYVYTYDADGKVIRNERTINRFNFGMK